MSLVMLLRLLICSTVAFALSGCLSARDGGGPPGTSSTGWHQIAVGTGQVIGATKVDAKVAKASEKLSQYCIWLRSAAAVGTIFAPEKQRKVANMASAAVNTVCDSPPTDVATALVTAARAYDAVIAAQTLPET